MVKSFVVVLLICVVLAVVPLDSRQALGGTVVKQSSLVKRVVKKAAKGALVIGVAATLLFGNPFSVKQQPDKLKPLQATDSFRDAVLELNPLLLAQAAQDTDVNKALFADGSTALHYAAANGYLQDEHSKLKVIDTLMAHGADPYLENHHGVSVFDMVASDTQSGLALSAILGKHVYGINAADGLGVRPIEYAIKHTAKVHDLWLAQELARDGADVSVLQNSQYTNGILNYLTHGDRYKVLEDAAMLADADQFLSAVDTAGERNKVIETVGDYLFAVAANHDNFAVAEALIRLGVDPNKHVYRDTQDKSLRVPRKMPESSDIEYVEWLLGMGVEPNKNSTNGINMLHLAAWHGEVDTARLLLANGADPTFACDYRKRTALHYALTDGNGDHPIRVFMLVNTLLAHNAATTSAVNLTEVRDYSGSRPYDIAMRYTDDSFNSYSFRSYTIINAATAAILAANMQSKDPKGRTAAYWADLSGLDKIKSLITNQQKRYLSGEELDSFAAYLTRQMSVWDE